MCALVGFLNPSSSKKTPQALNEIALRMSDTLIHRGPDDSGIWCDATLGIALAHRRLSILDLSQAGHQPMHSHSGRFVIVYNGEIYNHLEIRSELNHITNHSIKWQGHSDTETLLSAFEVWGLKETLLKAVGMFAFALWDRQTNTLTLAKDRVGEKPLYYGFVNSTFVFASELKAIKKHPEFCPEIDLEALALYFRYNYIPTPYCIYKGLKKLPAGTYLTFKDGQTHITPYWSMLDVVSNALDNLFDGTEAEAIATLQDLLKDTIKSQMLSDVPLGAFLSGGIDSSTVVALMQAVSPNKVKTFSIGFYEAQYNEAEHAKAVAKHLETEHTEMYVTFKDALDVVPLLPQIYDEPFADSSQIPTYLLSKLTRQYVTVSLSGDGGDEIFGGYNRYFWGNRIFNTFSGIPFSIRQMLTKLITMQPPERWDAVMTAFYKVLPQRYRFNMPGDRFHKLAEVIDAKDLKDMYTRLVSINKAPCELFDGCKEPKDTLMDKVLAVAKNHVQAMMLQDALTYLPDDILVKVDRASMACSLESRIPYLNHHIIEFAWRLPLQYKVRGNLNKWILRQILYKYVPQGLIERPKMGFGIPIEKWLRGELRDWANSLLSEESLKTAGLNAVIINKFWTEHLSGRRNWQYWLWGVLMYVAWSKHNEVNF